MSPIECVHRRLLIFARATDCDIFIVAKRRYTLLMLHLTLCDIKNTHRMLARFVWKSVFQRTTIGNLFWTLNSVGLGLFHLFLRQFPFVLFTPVIKPIRPPKLHTSDFNILAGLQAPSGQKEKVITAYRKCVKNRLSTITTTCDWLSISLPVRTIGLLLYFESGQSCRTLLLRFHEGLRGSRC